MASRLKGNNSFLRLVLWLTKPAASVESLFSLENLKKQLNSIKLNLLTARQATRNCLLCPAQPGKIRIVPQRRLFLRLLRTYWLLLLHQLQESRQMAKSQLLRKQQSQKKMFCHPTQLLALVKARIGKETITGMEWSHIYPLLKLFHLIQ